MKELTIEEKAKRYDEAIERAKDYYNKGKVVEFANYVASDIFPELKQSEDERISEEIMTYLSTIDDKELIPYESWIAWIKKQVKQKPIERKEFTSIPFGAFDSELYEQMFTIPDGCVATIEGNRIHIKREYKTATEAIKEEKVNNTNNFEPKFKVGDIVQYITDSTDRRKIEEVDTFCNMYHTDSSPILFDIEDEWKVVVNAEDVEVNAKDVEYNPTDKIKQKLKIGDYVVRRSCKNFHDGRNFAKIIEIDGSICQLDNGRWLYDYEIRPWSISDAEDGDVLASSSNKAFIYNNWFNESQVGAYCGLNIHNEFVISNKNWYWTDNYNIRPATKEECQSLFNEMKLLGWTWNPETKELNRLDEDEQNNN